MVELIRLPLQFIPPCLRLIWKLIHGLVRYIHILMVALMKNLCINGGFTSIL